MPPPRVLHCGALKNSEAKSNRAAQNHLSEKLESQGKNQKPWRRESHVSRNYQKANDGPPFDLTLSLSPEIFFPVFAALI